MKKLIFLIIITLCFSATAFAVTTPADTGASSIDGETLYGATPANLDIAKSSKGVYFGWSTGSTGYAIATYHKSGTKVYGTAYDSTALYFQDVGTLVTANIGTTITPSDSSSDTAFPDDVWTEM